ncbi:DUF1176 domain-containing protein [Blastomonas aquatica]|uniref:DUF1176 domain-containing protein n=1 Tax=Blastomonas aquatica TaxID=1510276 RepID=A0ABQ1JAQ8_9SPHN|nr:DUF1176 domain-containing protein [Blastomonas aquatica]GGB63981.1 hypothetical protein GCM10010833_18740 [Blastomonas aquatica]
MLSALLLAATAAASAPVPGEVKVFKDWYVACDNVWSCEAGTLGPVDGDFTGAMALRIHRGGGPHAPLRIQLTPGEDMASGPARLKIDARPLLAGSPDAEGDTRLDEAQSLAIARMLASGSNASLILSDGKPLPVSLAGSSAALRYMDSVQQRAGTIGAIIATGTKPDSALPPALPQLTARAASKLTELPDLRRYPQIIAETGCEYRMEGVEDTVHPLGQRGGLDMALVLISCDSGAYNFGSAVMVATRPMEDPNAGWEFAPAKFDSATGWGDDDQVAQVVNADFAPETGTLYDRAKGRGIGDCGVASSYVWDGEKFHLSEKHEMGECRGVWEWPRVWATEVLLVR